MCLLIDFKEAKTKDKNPVVKKVSTSEVDISGATTEGKVCDTETDLESNRKKDVNPYDYPEDF